MDDLWIIFGFSLLDDALVRWSRQAACQISLTDAQAAFKVDFSLSHRHVDEPWTCFVLSQTKLRILDINYRAVIAEFIGRFIFKNMVHDTCYGLPLLVLYHNWIPNAFIVKLSVIRCLVGIKSLQQLNVALIKFPALVRITLNWSVLDFDIWSAVEDVVHDFIQICCFRVIYVLDCMRLTTVFGSVCVSLGIVCWMLLNQIAFFANWI